MTSEQTLEAAGWEQTRTGRWTHHGLRVVQGRRRPFTTAEALTLVDALTREVEA